MANRCGGVSDPHHRLSPQTSRRPPKSGSGGSDHDSVSRLCAVLGLLPPAGLQSCAWPLRRLPRIRQALGLRVHCSLAQYQLDGGRGPSRGMPNQLSRCPSGRRAPVFPPPPKNHAAEPLSSAWHSPRPITISKYLAWGSQLPAKQPADYEGLLRLRNRWVQLALTIQISAHCSTI